MTDWKVQPRTGGSRSIPPLTAQRSQPSGHPTYPGAQPDPQPSHLSHSSFAQHSYEPPSWARTAEPAPQPVDSAQQFEPQPYEPAPYEPEAPQPRFAEKPMLSRRPPFEQPLYNTAPEPQPMPQQYMSEPQPDFAQYEQPAYAAYAQPAHQSAHDPVYEDDERAGAVFGARQIIGAMVSFMLFLGICVWGYQLMMRDVNGVPVVRAMAGDVRSVPMDPGGQPATHQGLAVNTVTSEGEAESTAERVTLAPEPLGLTGEDAPMGQVASLSETTQTQQAYEIVQPFDLSQATPLTPLTDDVSLEATQASDPSLDQVAVEEDPLELSSVRVVSSSAQIVYGETPDPRDAADAPVVGLKTSLVPKARPASPSASANQLIQAVATADEIKVQDVPVGARLVQFSAYKSQDTARAEWDRLSQKFGELLDGKQRVLEQASSGGQTFYRLRAYGFKDAADADRFCAAVTAMREQCVPTVQR